MRLRKGIGVDIAKAEHLGAGRLALHFTDGHETTVDFGPFLRRSAHPGMRRFLKPVAFREYRIEYGNLVWGDYEMCFPIADLYEGVIGQPASGEPPLSRVAEGRAKYGG